MAQALYQPPEHIVKGAHVDSLAKYKDMHARSLKDPEVRARDAVRPSQCARHAEVSMLLTPSPLPLLPLQGFWGEFMEQFHWNKKWDSGPEFHK